MRTEEEEEILQNIQKEMHTYNKNLRKTYRSHSEGIPIPFRRKREGGRKNV